MPYHQQLNIKTALGSPFRLVICNYNVSVSSICIQAFHYCVVLHLLGLGLALIVALSVRLPPLLTCCSFSFSILFLLASPTHSVGHFRFQMLFWSHCPIFRRLHECSAGLSQGITPSSKL